MLVDVAINSFGADIGDMVVAAQTAENAGAACVWVTDHFSGAVVGAPFTRDPFVCLGAIGASTERVDVGVLVANVVNRHPAQLASAVNSLQSLAPGRVRLGVGSGAAPGSRFAVEHEAIGRQLGDLTERRRLLIDSIEALRAIWRGDADHAAPDVGFAGLSGVVDGSTCPTIVVGASAWPTVAAALTHADGVNVRATAGLWALLERIGADRPGAFEVSVLASATDDLDRSRLAAAGCDRLIVGVSPPFDAGLVRRIIAP